MRSDCPKCYTPMELDDWQKSQSGEWTTVWMRCPCCDHTQLDFDFAGAPQPQLGTRPDGTPLSRETLHEFYARWDARQAQRAAQGKP